MPCTDPNTVQRQNARPGDVCDIWIDECTAMYFMSGSRLIVHEDGTQHTTNVLESDLQLGVPLSYTYKRGEFYSVTLLFDPQAAAGKKSHVHARVTRGGVAVDNWCTEIKSGTADPDYASYALKGI